MTEITIVQIENQLVVDSRIIAEQLGIKHLSFLKLIKAHKATIEANFGVVRFEIHKPLEGSQGGRPETFYWLTESQATFLMALSRNTPEVISCKVGLIKAFDEQKKQLENPADRALLNELANRIAKLEEQSVLALPPVVPEMSRVAQVKELVLNHADRLGATNPQPIWRLLYTKFGLLYPQWKPMPKDKTKLSKVLQIEAAGLIEELYQLALKLFI